MKPLQHVLHLFGGCGCACAHSMLKFPGQESNPHHNSDHTGSLITRPPGNSLSHTLFFFFLPSGPVPHTFVWESQDSDNHTNSKSQLLNEIYLFVPGKKKLLEKDTINGGPPHHFSFCISFFLFLSFFFFFVFLGPHLQHMEVPRLRVELQLQLQAYAQLQQCQIQATLVTYSIAHSNAGSLTH